MKVEISDEELVLMAACAYVTVSQHTFNPVDVPLSPRQIQVIYKLAGRMKNSAENSVWKDMEVEGLAASDELRKLLSDMLFGAVKEGEGEEIN